MCSYTMLRLACLVAVFIVCSCGVLAVQLGVIEVKERLGVEFVPQVLHYTLEVKPNALTDVAQCALKDEQGAPVLAQFTVQDRGDDNSVRHLGVSFITGLAKYQTRTFTLDDSGQGAKDDGALKIAADGDSIVLSSPLVAVRVPALSQVFPGAGMSAQLAPPPVSQVRGKTKWYGKGTLDSIQNVKERKVSVAVDGPITKQVAVEYTFAGGEKYVVNITLNRGEELVRISENFTLTFSEPTRSQFAFNLAPGLAPDRSVCQPVQRGSVASTGSLWDLSPYRGEMFTINYDRDDTYGALTPWSAHPGQWVHFACYNSNGGDMLGIINTAPERWDNQAYFSRADSWKLVQNPHMFFTLRLIKNVDITTGKDGSLTAHFGLTTGHREWAFFVSSDFPKTDDIMENGALKSYPSGPRTYFTQKTRDYFWNSLDRIKDYTLAWTADKQLAYPHVYASGAELEERRVKFNAWHGGVTIPPLDDPAVRQRMKQLILAQSEQAIQKFTTNPGPPHHIASDVYPIANISDLLLGTGTLTAEEETRLKARLAYMAYMMNWRGYWGPEMGYAGNPNMSSFCYDAVGLLGLLLADHPNSSAWIESCTTQLDREFANWASEDGAWIESLHYVRAAWQEHTMLMQALKHSSVKDYYRDPRVRKFIEYYAAIQTPPDPQFNNQRGIACIGNAYAFEPVAEFNAWARGMADVDPKFAGNLMWMWKQEGFGNAEEIKGKTFPMYGAGHASWWSANAGLPPYHELALYDPTIPVIEPESTNGHKFAGFGAVMNAHFPGPKETRMYVREGDFYSHWDADQGSFVLWGKGAPLCMDHGYGEYLPWLHNRISVNHLYDEKLGDVTSFFAGQGADFLHGDVILDGLSQREYPGTKQWPMQPEPLNGRKMTTPWSRRIVFMKDADPDGPNYFVMRDIVSGELPTEWCLWVYGSIADFTATPIRATGKFGVDLLVYLLDKDKGTVNTGTVEFPPDRRKQTLIHLKRPAGRGVLSVLYPILPAQQAPVVTTLGNNDGIKLTAGNRTDWVFVPEQQMTVTADGITFNGMAGSFSRRGKTTHYFIERNATITADSLTIGSNFAAELFVNGQQINGSTSSRDARPVLTLSGPLAAKITAVTCAGKTEPVIAKDGKITLTFPLGETRFELVVK